MKNGGPTVTWVPRTSSEIIGKTVPHNTEKAMPTSSRLLKKKLASRERALSSLASVCSRSQRDQVSHAMNTPPRSRNQAKNVPTGDWANECTLEMMPLRVMKVPKMESANENPTRITFHRFSIPRFSWIMTECRNAVIVSQGRKLAFSTGSQAQYPPHPSSTYAHHMPSVMPTERNTHESNVHLRIACSQPTSSRRERRAATANANGMVIET